MLGAIAGNRTWRAGDLAPGNNQSFPSSILNKNKNN
jgi:hypothetical protein